MAGTGLAMTGETVMHDIKWIRDNPEAFDKALKRRGFAPESAQLIAIDERRRRAIVALEQAQASRNAVSKAIGEAKKAGDEALAQRQMAHMSSLKAMVPALEDEEKRATDDLNEALAPIPNLPLKDVPDGVDEHGNVEHHRFGAKRDYALAPRQHFELGEALGQMDFETAAKLSGARFVVLRKGLARLERALGQFMLDLHTNEHGYTEVAPPLLVRDEVMFGTTQLPKFADDQFFATRTITRTELLHDALKYANDTDKEEFKNGIIDLPTLVDRILERAPLREDFWLIPTAEVPLTNLVRESIRDEAELPMRFTALTPCFRAEAGAAGKDTRGMIRQHQFTKVELVSIATPEQSRDEHERMLSCAEEVLKRLELHYRVVTLCAGDMGFAAQKTYDIEVWLPGQKLFREISSCSVCGEFQARRMAARYRTKEGRQVRHVHTLNGSGVAVGRALIAVMETYQQADGSIAVPDVLQSYMGGMKVIATT
jgi:seryl-tRNA synthetase